MSPDDVRVTRLLLAHAKAQGWKREPIDITVDGDHDGTYHNYTWSTMDLRICVVALLLEQREPDWPTDWWVNVFDNNGPGAGIERPTSAQQVADCLAAVGLVPVELTSGWAAGYRLGYIHADNGYGALLDVDA